MKVIKKEIVFHNDKILTLNKEGKIYISVKDVCENLGMTKSQVATQRDKVNNDDTLKGGGKFLPLETNGGIQQVLMLELDYLPIWLAKINPSRFNEELKQKLLDYQLHCKDILADEFFGKREMVLLGKENERVNPHLNDIEDRVHIIRGIEKTLIDLYEELKYHYNWINYRAGIQREKNDFRITDGKQTKFILDGEELTTETIDKLNGR